MGGGSFNLSFLCRSFLNLTVKNWKWKTEYGIWKSVHFCRLSQNKIKTVYFLDTVYNEVENVPSSCGKFTREDWKLHILQPVSCTGASAKSMLYGRSSALQWFCNVSEEARLNAWHEADASSSSNGMVWYGIVGFNVPRTRHSIGHFGDRAAAASSVTSHADVKICRYIISCGGRHCGVLLLLLLIAFVVI